MPATLFGWALLAAMTAALTVTVIGMWNDRHRPHPPEFDDVQALDEAMRQRAALRRATTPRSLR